MSQLVCHDRSGGRTFIYNVSCLKDETRDGQRVHVFQVLGSFDDSLLETIESVQVGTEGEKKDFIEYKREGAMTKFYIKASPTY